jgi:hypothetical protein
MERLAPLAWMLATNAALNRQNYFGWQIDNLQQNIKINNSYHNYSQNTAPSNNTIVQ